MVVQEDLTLRPFTVATMILILAGDTGLFMATRLPDLQGTDHRLQGTGLREWGVPLAADLRVWGAPLAADLRV